MNERIARFNRILKIREDSRKNEQAISDFSRAGGKAVSATDLWFQRQFIDAINTDIIRGQDSLAEVRTRIAGTEARLVERHKDVRIMETYIDKLKEADFHEQLGIEQNELDDVATMQFSRKGDY